MLNKTYRRVVGRAASALVFVLAPAAFADGPISATGWSHVQGISDAMRASIRSDAPESYAVYRLSEPVMRTALAGAPHEDTLEAARPAVIELPMPDGKLHRFWALESPIMEPELAAKVPEVRSFTAQGIDDPAAVARFDISPRGFHAMIRSEGGTVFINPATEDQSDLYMAFNIKDARLTAFTCGVTAREQALAIRDMPVAEPGDVTIQRVGPTRRQYRLALAATGEFTDVYGNGDVNNTLAAMNTLMNRVNLVYENDVGVRMNIIATNNLIIWTNEFSDPFTGSDADLLGQVSGAINSQISSSSYDIGHLLNAGGGSGIANLSVVCSGNKARGVSSVGGAIDGISAVGLVVHEMGHQFSAPHSFNSNQGACLDNWSSFGGYEPGSGSTPMSYAGICGVDNLQSDPDLYFHTGSFDRILNHISFSATCSANNVTGNTAPTVNGGPNRVIPARTPFVLTATASDAQGDALTYTWEQFDLGPQNQVGSADPGSGPLFRSFPPTSNPVRFLPALQTILTGATIFGENLPTTTRTMNWRITVRDNRAGGGGVNTDDVAISVVNTGAPFRVTFPNGGQQLSQDITVTWDVAGTTAAPISTATVNIELSTDGGNTWPTLLGTVANTGSATVTLPAVSSSQARIRVFAANSIYFDVSDANFVVTPVPAPTPFNLTAPANTAIGVSRTPTLQWTSSTNATSYDVLIDTDVNFNPPNTFSTNVVGTSFAVPSGVLNGNTLYYWRVSATNGQASTVGTPNPSQFITAPLPPFCSGNANGDAAVNFNDISSVLANFGALYTPGSRGLGDANNDGGVNFADISAVLASFGATCQI